MLINLLDLINFSNNERLSQKYLKYYLGFKASKQYRHEEILTIQKMLELLDLDYEYLGGFSYSFVLPHLNKELDLIKVTKNAVINIELKSSKISNSRILKQLMQNKYYLHLIHKPMYQYTYVMSENKFYKIENDLLIEASLDELRKVLCSHKKAISIDLNDIFKPENIFASPLYMVERFIKNDYLLTDSEQATQRQIFKMLENDEDCAVIGPTGSGKTMVLYDIARNLNDVLVISPFESDSFKRLNEAFKSFKTISFDEFKGFKDIKYCLIDEANRFDYKSLFAIAQEAKALNIRIVYFLDNKEADEELNSFIVNNTSNILKLTSTIRAPKEALAFIDAILYHKKCNPSDKYKIVYTKQCFLNNKIEDYIKKGFTFISYEDGDKGSDFSYKLYTKRAYPHEFEKIVMCIDDRFYLDERKHLKSLQAEGGSYYTRLLYQGLTRAREEIVLIVTNEEVLNGLIEII